MRARRGRRTFVDEMCTRTSVELAPDPELAVAAKVAIVAHFSQHSLVSLSMRRLVSELSSNGYRCIVVSTSPAGPLEWPDGVPPGTAVLRRANEGYDFGSWAVGLELFPEARRARHVILTNDSMAGPFEQIGPLLAAFESAPTDVWAVTDSHQLTHHLQSYFVGFNGGVLDESPWRRFFRGVHHHEEKMDIVMRYELGLMRVCRTEGYPWTVQYRASDVGVGLENPTLAGWRQLLSLGFPFVKRTIITDPSTAPGGDQVAAVIRRKYGTELSDWI